MDSEIEILHKLVILGPRRGFQKTNEDFLVIFAVQGAPRMVQGSLGRSRDGRQNCHKWGFSWCRPSSIPVDNGLADSGQ